MNYNFFLLELANYNFKINRLKKAKEILCKEYSKELKKQWKKLMWTKNINDVWGEREPKIVDIKKK